MRGEVPHHQHDRSCKKQPIRRVLKKYLGSRSHGLNHGYRFTIIIILHKESCSFKSAVLLENKTPLGLYADAQVTICLPHSQLLERLGATVSVLLGHTPVCVCVYKATFHVAL